jgi:two-component system, sensor histidine kinase
VGRGSTFTLEMPAGARTAESGPTAASAADRPEGVTGSARILLVDDDAGVRNATTMLLKVEGFEVLCAASIAEVNQTLRRTRGSIS